ncbi:MAG TPA: AEC family transporter, partial [Paracoccaceae bacterium]|nr:AEC family transporter [Paracoccaceae bacterium]
MDIILKVLEIVAPVFILVSIGFAWVKARLAYDLAFVTRLAMQLGTPCLLFVALARAEMDRRILADLALATVVGYAAVALLSYGLCLAARLNIRSFLSPLIFGNTGNLGLPVVLFAYGQTGLAYALVIFAIMAVINFSLGVWLVSGEGSREMFRQPILYGALLGGLSMLTERQPPGWVMATLDLIGQTAIPLMLLTLGVAVARLSARDVGRAILLSGLKLAIGLAVGVAVVNAAGIGWGPAGGAFLLQLAMPVAVTSYLLATRYAA